ncbi:MAG TPA: ATP-binding protein [Polyangiaceae bacterium]|nr:ATP-binding protein [Polyangiaceae bacterium]
MSDPASTTSPVVLEDVALEPRPTFDDLPDGVLVMSLSGRIEFANSAFLAMLGRELAEVVGQPIEAIVAAEDMLHLLGVQAIFAAATRDSNMIFTTADGGLRPLIVCTTRSLEQSRIFLTARASGAVQEELATTTRWAAAEQDRATELAQARDALASNNEALRAAQEETQAAYTKLQEEVATRERLEKDLRLAQKLESIGQLAAGVAHEINTPMQYVGDNVAFLSRAFSKFSEHLDVARGAVDGDSARSLDEARALLESSKVQLKLDFLLKNVPKALQDSQAGIEHVSNIVRAMKSFAHVDQDEKAAGDINRALADTLIVAQNEYKSVAKVETDFGQLPPILCFQGRLNQVFLNLIVNAAHAIGETKRTDGSIRVVSRCDGVAVTVTISDNGGGIPLKIQHQVFDPFFTTKPVGKGTGQGLTLARDIVSAHGGTLTFETVPGQGTDFIVRLPLSGSA